MYRFRCPKCGQTIEDPEDLTGSPCPVCGTVIGDSESALRLSPGDKIGGYEIIRLLGSGGTGNVYLALQLSMSRQIALKVLYPELTEDEDSVNQFLGEVKTLGIIQHSHIVCAFDSGLDKDRRLYYLAMQYIPGKPLDAVVAQSGPLPISKALKIVERIAEALNYVWTKYQLCHRDIKPGNIMLNDDEVPMLLDFGAVLHSGENSISNGLVEGSPCFMSPEQARGEKLTFASDLYSLGETLYYLITGVAPFEDSDVREILRKQCEEPFPLPEQRKPGSKVPSDVVSFLRKTMAKSPVDRFESWESFLVDLRKVKKSLSGKSTATRGIARSSLSKSGSKLSGGPDVLAKATSPNTAPAKRRHPFLLAVCYLMSTLLTAGAIAYMLARRNTQSAENRMIEVQAAMKNVRENDKDPDGAKDKIRKALAETRKFGVDKEVAQAIKNECDEELRFIENLEEENRKVEQVRLTVSSLAADLRDTKAALKRGDSKETREELRRIQSALKEQSAKILATTFARPSNEEKVRLIVTDINGLNQAISKLLEPAAPVSTPVSKQTVKPAAEKKIAAEKKQSSRADDEKARKKKEEEEKQRRRDRYRKNVEREKERVARDVVRKVRNGEPERVEQILAAGAMKAPDPDCRETETAYNAWLTSLRDIYHEAKPILKQVPPDITGKKEKIYSLTGGNKKLLSRSLMLFGYFSEAQKLVQPEDKQMFRDIYVAYLTPRIERAITNARKGNDKELVDLRQEYENFESYTDLENKIRARITGGK